MNETDFKVYYDHLIQTYAEDNVIHGDWDENEAFDLAKFQMKALLPNGLNSSDHYLFSLFHEKLNMNIGQLWVQIQEIKTTKKAFIFDIEIFDVFRGKGFGTEAIKVLEEWLIASGVKSLGLHVYASNPVARELYLKSGFTDMSYNMVKTLNITPKGD